MLIERRVVIQGQLVHVDFHGFVEKNRRTRLSLEVDEEHLVGALWYLKNFKLHLGCLNYGHKFFLLLLLVTVLILRLLVNLLFALEVDFPDVVSDLEGLVLELQIFNQLRKDLLRRDRREKAVSPIGAFLVLLECEQNRVAVVPLTLGQLGVFVPPVVELISDVTARLSLNMRFHGLLAVLLLLRHGLVGLVARNELLTHLLGVGKLAALQPRMRDDVGDG